MKAYKASIFIVQFFIVVHAVSQTKAIEKILQKAGKNRIELQKVLDHYRTDSLKFKSACFLIENMDIHYSQTYYWADSLNQKVSFDELDYPDYNTSTLAQEELKEQIHGLHPVSVTIWDIDVITSDYLIRNIDNAFAVWEQNKENRISFDEFCEYILPYRLSVEPLQNWRELYAHKFSWINDSISINPTRIPSQCVSNYMAQYFKNTFSHEQRAEPLSRLGALQLLHRMKGPCEDITAMETFILRSQGYPASQELIPYWATSSGNHLIASTWVDKFQKHVSLEVDKIDSLQDKQFLREPSKVIRITYSKQPDLLANFEDKENIPDNFLRSHNYKDVTSDYWPTTNFSCQLANVFNHKIVYACVLNYQFWQPTWWSKIAGDSATFSNMTKGVVYLPAYFEKNKLIPAGYPMALGFNHQVELKPDTLHSRTVKIEPQEKFLKFRPLKRYTLLYWDNKWINAGTQTTGENTQELIYEKVPRNVLLILIPEYSEHKERPFMITDEGYRVWF